jgi:hypothetical protein
MKRKILERLEETKTVSKMDDLDLKNVRAGENVYVCGYEKLIGRVVYIMRNTQKEVTEFSLLTKSKESYRFGRGVCDYIMQIHTPEEMEAVGSI